MKNILFRAKEDHTGRWCYGFFTGTPDFLEVLENTDCKITKIDINTVCQYIGRNCTETDVPIFEGDIITNGKDTGYIEYDDFHASFRVRASFVYSGNRAIFAGKILGNIYDNKDLLIEPEPNVDNSRTSTYEKWSKKNQREIFKQMRIK